MAPFTTFVRGALALADGPDPINGPGDYGAAGALVDWSVPGGGGGGGAAAAAAAAGD
ncbi:hypothetical protein UVI_02053770 [Ustilaginoidea virens]|uniref:Uncharacterized protein n=1 Tax=Ustilaginoidea virens TaxID=1159556 RepID=A0A1B5KY94_USTVR|nr:hypothetical protein UVI_02053770 [Ustilaginoidea virens]